MRVLSFCNLDRGESENYAVDKKTYEFITWKPAFSEYMETDCGYRVGTIRCSCFEKVGSNGYSPLFQHSKNCWIESLANKKLKNKKDAFEFLETIVLETMNQEALVNFKALEKILKILAHVIFYVENNISELKLEEKSIFFQNATYAFSNLISQYDGWITAIDSKKSEIASNILMDILNMTSFIAYNLQKEFPYMRIQKKNVEILISTNSYGKYNFFEKNSSIIVAENLKIDGIIDNPYFNISIKRLDNYLLNGINESQILNTNINLYERITNELKVSNFDDITLAKIKTVRTQ
jgi:hypothetical protein